MYRGYAYVENGRAIDIVDFREPLNPTFVYQFKTSSCARMAFTFKGDTLFLADDNEIRAYDIFEPATPQFLGSYSHTHGFQNLICHNCHICAISEEGGLEIFEYLDVNSPILLSTTNCGYQPRPAVLRDSLIYIAAVGQLYCYNISNLVDPSFVDILSLPSPSLDMISEGDYLYLANCDSGVKIINISDPEEMTLVQSVPVFDWSRGLVIQGNYLFTTDWWGFVYTIDISTPENAFIAATFEATDFLVGCGEIRAYSHSLFLSSYGEGVHVLDLTDPLNLSIAATYDVPAASYGIEKRNNFLYVGAFTDGLRIVDISDVYDPLDVNSAFLPSPVWGLTLYDSLVVAPDIRESDVYFMDVSDPTDPEIVGIADHICQDVTTIDTLLVCTINPGGFEISDISDVTNPEPLGSLNLGWRVRGVVCKDNYAYVSRVDMNGPDSVSVIDISNPHNPQLIYSTPIEAPYSLAIKDDLLLVGAEGLHIFDITNPALPVEIGASEFVPEGEWCQGIAVSGSFAYVCCTFTYEVRAYNISDPTRPDEIDRYYAGFFSHVGDVAAWGDLLAITCGNAGIRILRNTIWYESVDEKYELMIPQNLTLFPPAPNPFNSSTILRFQLPVTQSITLDVYDIQGRLLKTVASGMYPAGDHSLSLDGSDLASGMCFVRLAGSGGAVTRKITLVK